MVVEKVKFRYVVLVALITFLLGLGVPTTALDDQSRMNHLELVRELKAIKECMCKR